VGKIILATNQLQILEKIMGKRMGSSGKSYNINDIV